MFEFTRSERVLIASLTLAFVVGLAVKHYRATDATLPSPPDSQHAKR